MSNTTIKKLFITIEHHDVTDVLNLLLRNVDFELNDVYGRTPLIAAAENGYSDLVKILLENGANPNASDRLGVTVLMEVVLLEEIESVANLIQYNADVNAKTHSDRSVRYNNVCATLSGEHTALMYAAQRLSKDIATLLIGAGADLNAKDTSGSTALIEAICANRLSMDHDVSKFAEYIIGQGTKVNTKTLMVSVLYFTLLNMVILKRRRPY